MMVTLKALTDKEEVQREAICDTHGAYISTARSSVLALANNASYAWSSCPACSEKREREREAKYQQIIAEGEREMTQRRLKAACIPPRFQGKTFETFNTSSEQQCAALRACTDYAGRFEEHLAAGRCLALLGSVGTGKTHLACALAHTLALGGHSVRYATAADIIRELRQSWNGRSDRSETAVLRDLVNHVLLIIDEVGVQFGADAEIVQLTDLLDQRYRELKPTMVISNCDKEGLNQFLGERAVDRLRENGGIVVPCKWQSWRGRIQQNTQTVRGALSVS